MLAGLAIIALSIAGIPLTGGLSLIGLSAGIPLTGTGAMFFHKAHKEQAFSSSLTSLTNVAEAPRNR